jgi:hypothetical protein
MAIKVLVVKKKLLPENFLDSLAECYACSEPLKHSEILIVSRNLKVRGTFYYHLDCAAGKNLIELPGTPDPV